MALCRFEIWKKRKKMRNQIFEGDISIKSEGFSQGFNQECNDFD